MKWCG